MTTLVEKDVSGTGAFKLARFEAEASLTATRNPDYWNLENIGNITDLEIFYIPSDTEQTAKLLRGDLDFIDRLNTNQLLRIERSDDYHYHQLPPTNTVFFHFNHRRAEFQDVRVRQAIAHALNHDRILQSTYGDGGAITRTLASKTLGLDDSLEEDRYDVIKAKQLMAEAGFSDGFVIRAITPSIFPKLPSTLRSQLAAIGIEVFSDELPTGEYMEALGVQGTLSGKGYDIILDLAPKQTFSATILSDILKCNSTANEGGFCDPSFDGLIEDLAFFSSTRDFQKLTEFENKIHRRVYDEALILPFVARASFITSVSNLSLEGIMDETTLQPIFQNMVLTPKN